MSDNSQRRIRWLWAAIVLVVCVGCDQATKHVATRALRDEPVRSYFGDTVQLQFAQNPGGFLSLGQSLSPQLRFACFVLVNLCLLSVVLWFLVTRWSMPWTQFLALVLLLAGGVGNLIDRVTQQGLVTDFLVVGIGPLRTGVFNVADIAVTCGAIALLVLMSRQPPPAADAAQPMTK